MSYDDVEEAAKKKAGKKRKAPPHFMHSANAVKALNKAAHAAHQGKDGAAAKHLAAAHRHAMKAVAGKYK